MVLPLLLCLKCRQTGHLPLNCPSDDWGDSIDWFFSEARRAFDTIVNDGSTEGSLCSRCEGLDLIPFLESQPPWRSQEEFPSDFEEHLSVVKKLGKIGTTEFWSSCALCRCLYGLTPQPSSEDQDILLVPDWTISRTSGELGVVTMDSPEKRKYATCLLSVLQPSLRPLHTRIIAHRGDALCLEGSDSGSVPSLTGRRIQSSGIDTDRVLHWVASCVERHDESCLPVYTEALKQIRLIDIETRAIVEFPGPGCEYIALSYVCGPMTQERYTLGDDVGKLPRTLEDALVLTRRLGKSYTWIDSVCINQYDDVDKSNQIDRMWGIYQGAWLTVIVLSGTSADSGIPHISRRRQFPQLSCDIGGKTILGLMPTLSQQIWTAPWGGRAWTLQEGLLSARCLYIGDHQTYYDCLSMQCCDSLDESHSWAHNLTPDSNPTKEGYVTWMLRQAGAGALRVPTDWPSRRLEHWGEKLNLYSYRNMTYAEDAIRAFTGVLQRLQVIYPKGFFWGLPYEDFDWALLWRSQVPPTRRENFPTWSWSGWKGPLFFGQPTDVRKTRRMPIDLQIDAAKAGLTETIFKSEVGHTRASGDLELHIFNDPIHVIAQMPPADAQVTLQSYPNAEKDGYLMITTTCLHFIPDFSTPRTGTQAAGQNETFLFIVRDVNCFIRIFSLDRIIRGNWEDGSWISKPQDQKRGVFILLSRDHLQGFVIHHLMLIEPAQKEPAEVWERVTVLELLIPLDELDILESFNPQRRRIVLT